LLAPLVNSNYAGYNISCNHCFNGSITANVTGGAAPYTYTWNYGQNNLANTSATINNLGVGRYGVSVTDANGCKADNESILTEPGNPGWDLHGNEADSSMAIGTTNNEGLNFKTNDSVRMRIGANGEVEVKNDLNLKGSLLFGNGGILKHYAATTNDPEVISFSPVPIGPIIDKFKYCTSAVQTTSPTMNLFSGLIQSHGVHLNGNFLNVLTMGFDGRNGLIELAGTSNTPTNEPKLYINRTCMKDVIICKAGGNVAIGDNYIPNGYRMSVNGKIIAEALTVKLRGNWPDYVFDKKYKLMSYLELEMFLNQNNHLPEMPSEKEIEKDGIDTGEIITKLLKQQEILTLYILEQNKRIEHLENLKTK
jgi:hypothetical protein